MSALYNNAIIEKWANIGAVFWATVRDKLSRILGVSLSKEENTDRTSADGLYVVVLEYKRIPILILEFKREYGEGGSDAPMQAGLSMKRSWIQKDVSLLRL